MTKYGYGKRIEAYRLERNLRQQDLAERCGWGSPSRIGNYEREVREPSLQDFEKMAEALGVPTAELIFGTHAAPAANSRVVAYDASSTHTAQLLIDCYHIQPAAGSAAPSWAPSDQEPLSIPHSVISTKGLQPQHLRAVRVSAANMHPYLAPGDTIGIDTSDTSPRNGEVYVVAFGGEWYIKRVFKEPTGLVLHSDASTERDITISPDALYTVQFFGRVFWRAG